MIHEGPDLVGIDSLLQDCTGDKGHRRNSAHDKQADHKRA
jgi:hypothetical protein